MAEKAKVYELRSLIYGKFNSEAQCAEVLGWSRQKLNKITSGEQVPDIVDLSELASCLEASIDYMAQIFLRHKSTNE